MNDNYFSWRKMKNKENEIFPAEDMLRDLEDNYTCAAARFISRVPSRDTVWTLTGKKNELSALIINSKSTLLPVLYRGNRAEGSCQYDMPQPKFLGGYFTLKKIHSIQGLKEEVIIIEDTVKKYGREISDIFDYDFMSLDLTAVNSDRWLRENKEISASIPGLVIRAPKMTDLDALAPLQAAYEHEEVLHKGSVFSPAASRINLASIIAGGNIFAAEVNGRIVGKINVSGISFTKYLIGGVFIHPDFRNMGIAGIMTSLFISSLIKDGRGVTLFVKKSNHAAQKLYTKLRFRAITDYRITYLYD